MVRTETHELIIEAIKEHHDKTGGKCGLRFVELLRITGLTFEQAKPFLLELHANKEYFVREGLNDKLFMYGKKKR